MIETAETLENMVNSLDASVNEQKYWMDRAVLELKTTKDQLNEISLDHWQSKFRIGNSESRIDQLLKEKISHFDFNVYVE